MLTFEILSGDLQSHYFPSIHDTEILGMYKARNTGTGNGMRGTRGMGEMLYSGECRQIFRGMFSNIPGNVLNIPGNVTKRSGECPQIFRGMSQNIPGNVAKLLSLISECFTVHCVLISSNQSEYLYSFPVCKNVLLANPKETF